MQEGEFKVNPPTCETSQNSHQRDAQAWQRSRKMGSWILERVEENVDKSLQCYRKFQQRGAQQVLTCIDRGNLLVTTERAVPLEQPESLLLGSEWEVCKWTQYWQICPSRNLAVKKYRATSGGKLPFSSYWRESLNLAYVIKRKTQLGLGRVKHMKYAISRSRKC